MNLVSLPRLYTLRSHSWFRVVLFATLACTSQLILPCLGAYGQGVVKYIGVVNTVVSGLTLTGSSLVDYSLAVDGSGNLYFIDPSSRVLKETLTAGSYSQSVVASNIGYPVGLAADATGNVYISDIVSNQVYKETLSAGSYTQSVIATNLGSPGGVAVDGSGTVYIADSSNHRIVKETPFGTGYSQTTIAVTGQNGAGPRTLTVDGGGNLFVLMSLGGLVEENYSGGAYTQSTISLLAATNGEYDAELGSSIAIDASGNIYIPYPNNYVVYKLMPTGGSNYTVSPLPSGPSGYSAGFSVQNNVACCTPIAVAVDSNGSVYVLDNYTQGTINKFTSLSGGSFGSTDVGMTVGPIYLYFQVTYANVAGANPDSISSAVLNNQTAGVPDFSYVQSTDTCVSAGGQYGNYDFCYYPVDFSPQASGSQRASVVVTDTFKNVATGAVTGVGAAPQISFLPANQTIVVGGATGPRIGPFGVAVDASENLYIADTYNRQLLKEAFSNGTYTQSVIPYTSTSGMGPVKVAVDGAGNLYVADGGPGIYKMTYSNSGYTQSLVKSVVVDHIAADRSGNVYWTGASGGAYKETYNASTGIYTETTIIGGSAVTTVVPSGIAVDGAGNVYIGDVSTREVIRETPVAGGGYNPSIVSTFPDVDTFFPVAVDSLNNVYAGAFATVLEETPSGNTYTGITLGTINSVPLYEMAVDGGGNVFVASSNAVVEIGSAHVPSVSFASTPVGSTSSDSPQTVTIENSGTGALIFPMPSSGNNPSISSNFSLGSLTTCPVVSSSSGPGTLSPGATCIYSVSFSPTTPGPVSGALVVTDNSSNATNPYATQSISLSGTATGQAQVPTATLSATSLTFASQTDGTTSSAQTLTLTNSGTAVLTIASIAASGDFAQTHTCGATLAIGASCTISVTFTPTAAGSRTGSITIADSATGSPQIVALSGTGIAPTSGIIISPAVLTFASATVGTMSAVQTLTLTNPGTAALSVTSIVVSGDFALTQNCGSSVAAGAHCTLSVTFTPTAAGTRTGAVTITDNANGSPQTVALSGTGAVSAVTAPTVTLSPTSLTFAPQADGITSAAQTVTLTNSGTAALSVTSITASGDFALTSNCGSSVAAGGNCTISVTFTPTAAGTRTGIVTITDNANGSPQTVALSGGGEGVSISTVSTGITIPSVGGSGTAAIQLSAVNGFTGTVNLTCAVTYLGQGTPTSPPTCSLTPAQAQVTGSSAASSTLMIGTTSASASLIRERELNGAKIALAAMFFFGLLPRRRYRKGILSALCLAVLYSVAVVGVIGCGGSSGGSNAGTSPTGHGTTMGNYQVVVTATSGTVTASTTIPINVQ
jgi:sugar lactone lactonase YvrE